jgi:hypothetical protein
LQQASPAGWLRFETPRRSIPGVNEAAVPPRPMPGEVPNSDDPRPFAIA